MSKYNRVIMGFNRCLLYCMATESLVRLSATVITMTGSQFPWQVTLMNDTFAIINFVILIFIMFRLKSLQIYMDVFNETGEDIRR